ncbi:hypothetical protein OK016_04640 [Vibrio chagasii]|nr:hypothetical protein [Vibrio chagasii]
MTAPVNILNPNKKSLKRTTRNYPGKRRLARCKSRESDGVVGCQTDCCRKIDELNILQATIVCDAAVMQVWAFQPIALIDGNRVPDCQWRYCSDLR